MDTEKSKGIPKKRRGILRIKDRILQCLIWAFSFITMGVLVWILIYIISNGISHINWEFISTIYKPVNNQHGIFPMILSTLYIVLITIVIATPIGICSAIYLVEYSRPGKVLSLIRFATETLSGIPSIIYGLFGYIFFVIALHLKWSLLSGALTLSIMVLPTIIRTTEESLKSVPIAYKEGSLALGATKLTTIAKVILPCAISGILTAVILSIGRIVGETAAVYLTAGYVTRIPTSIMDSGRTLSVHLYQLAKEGISFEQSFATAAVLVVIVAIINLFATTLAKGIKKFTIGG
ncbi:phosphate ABC transporter membrane protein 2 (PhoT family) [Anaerobacterium chartisolvens]|uniref:Phosphate transport system permease protein PstA n=1 Tax=Anaerobacterium chartisolvens TaxID=1297424 RepID=A0A369B7N5_9FIRM|nr:phosphate ABC transporter permease PstA [Anaerobacterium chartisolvens]RCX17542.1 phosphate ABC transporter membrane protein 2 (PhoT family) [Anaerobacterium chartisolvens]